MTRGSTFVLTFVSTLQTDRNKYGVIKIYKENYTTNKLTQKYNKKKLCKTTRGSTFVLTFAKNLQTDSIVIFKTIKF